MSRLLINSPLSLSPPLVSVCIPTYQGAQYLEFTIKSVLNQTYPNFELWIVNDCSPDNTDQVVQIFNDSRIQYIKRKYNYGYSSTWNLCLSLARGKYFKLLPHDDLLTLDCIKTQVVAMESDDKAALTFGYKSIIDKYNNKLMEIPFRTLSHKSIYSQDEIVAACLQAGTNIIGEPGNVLVRRNLIEGRVLYRETLPYVIDLDFYLQLLQYGTAIYTPLQCSQFRLTNTSWTNKLLWRQHTDFISLITDNLGELDSHPIRHFLSKKLLYFKVHCRWIIRLFAFFFISKMSPKVYLLVNARMLRFAGFGILNTLIAYMVYFFALRAGIPFYNASLLASLMGIITGFTFQSTYVFKAFAPSMIYKYAISWLLIYVFNTSLIALLILASLPASLAGIIALPLTILLSYALSSRLVFLRT